MEINNNIDTGILKITIKLSDKTIHINCNWHDCMEPLLIETENCHPMPDHWDNFQITQCKRNIGYHEGQFANAISIELERAFYQPSFIYIISTCEDDKRVLNVSFEF